MTASAASAGQPFHGAVRNDRIDTPLWPDDDVRVSAGADLAAVAPAHHREAATGTFGR